MKKIPMTNAIRVKMKERQLEIHKKYIENTTRNVENAEFYDLAMQMIEVLPSDIERFRGLAEFDKMVEEGGENAPTVVRFGNTGETLNDIVQRYVYSYKMTPNKPMLKELAEMYVDLLEEEINRLEKVDCDYVDKLSRELLKDFKDVDLNETNGGIFGKCKGYVIMLKHEKEFTEELFNNPFGSTAHLPLTYQLNVVNDFWENLTSINDIKEPKHKNYGVELPSVEVLARDIKQFISELEG